MPIEPSEIRTFAPEIAELYQSEVAWRAAVSRLYYGVYLHARDRLNIAQRRRSHEEVRAAIQRRTQRSVGEQMSELRELREMADYEMNHNEWDQKYLKAMRLAERIMDALVKRGI
jgi:hypothetical protein